MLRPDLLARMRELQIQAVAIEHQREAIRKLYDAASMMNNGKLAEGYRQQLHDLLDVQLDNSSSLSQVTRSLIDSAG
jgi:ABC-type branched-subunit amino acid transport system ATPase component